MSETPRYCIGLEEDGEPDFKSLVGPRGFLCDLSEPEDALWCRDLQPAWDRLNELETESADLRRKLEATAIDLATLCGEHANWQRVAGDLAKCLEGMFAPLQAQKEERARLLAAFRALSEPTAQ